jgi:hypothetical protein
MTDPLFLPPGRALDALVAERVMGWPRRVPPSAFGHPWPTDTHWFTDHDSEVEHLWREDGKLCSMPFCPSTDITAAWQVVEKLREHYTNVSLHGANGWGLTAWNSALDGREYDLGGPINAATAPHAICLTALLALGEKES